jgi:hypothetical protein
MRLIPLTIPLLMFVLLLEFSSCEPGAACDCTMSINGESKTAKLCGEKLCFSDGTAFECTTEGSKEVSSCNSGAGGGGGSASGGGSATGGGTATGGGSASGGGTGGGSASGGGGGSGPSCMGTFSCGSITCNAAIEMCNTTYSPARCVANTTACKNSSSYCISATSVSNCMSGKRFSCSADSTTGGVSAGCQ